MTALNRKIKATVRKIHTCDAVIAVQTQSLKQHPQYGYFLLAGSVGGFTAGYGLRKCLKSGYGRLLLDYAAKTAMSSFWL